MPRKPLPKTNHALRLVREVSRWTQAEFQALARTPSQAIEIENGRKRISRADLEGFAARMGVPAVVVAIFLRVLDSFEPRAASELLPPEILLEAERAAIDGAEIAREHFLLEARAHWFARERREAEVRWRSLLEVDRKTWHAVVSVSPSFQRWAVVEKLCEESIHAAPRDAARALDLASFALEVARLENGPRDFCKRLLAYAEGHIGNALRVCGELRKSEAAFERANRLWVEGEEPTACPLDPAMLPWMESSLRRVRRELSDAYALLERALSLAPEHHRYKPMMYSNLGLLLDLMGQPAAAITALEKAIRQLDAAPEPRPRFAARFNLINSLLANGRVEEAASGFALLKKLALEIPGTHDHWRVDWLEARLAAAQGERGRALALLSTVSSRFEASHLDYDAALAKLEISGLLLEGGQKRQARDRSRGLVAIFNKHAVSLEGLRALYPRVLRRTGLRNVLQTWRGSEKES